MSSELETTSFFDSDEDDSTSRWDLTFIGAGMGMGDGCVCVCAFTRNGQISCARFDIFE